MGRPTNLAQMKSISNTCRLLYPTTPLDNNTPGKTVDASPAFAAGEFVNEDCAVIPENLVSIEPISPTTQSRNAAINPDATVTAAKQSHPVGEFVTNETGGVTSELTGDAEYSAFPEGSFHPRISDTLSELQRK